MPLSWVHCQRSGLEAGGSKRRVYGDRVI